MPTGTSSLDVRESAVRGSDRGKMMHISSNVDLHNMGTRTLKNYLVQTDVTILDKTKTH